MTAGQLIDRLQEFGDRGIEVVLAVDDGYAEVERLKFCGSSKLCLMSKGQPNIRFDDEDVPHRVNAPVVVDEPADLRGIDLSNNSDVG